MRPSRNHHKTAGFLTFWHAEADLRALKSDSKSVQKVNGYLINVSVDNTELIFETKRSAQPGDIINIRRNN